MFDLNFCVVQGRAAMDPMLSYLSDETAKVFFKIACNVGNGDSKADFIPVVAFGKTAENTARFVKKGTEVTAWGRINAKSWQNDAGEWQNNVSLSASRIKFHGGNNGQSDDEMSSIEDPNTVSKMLDLANETLGDDLKDLADSLLE